MRTSAFFGAKTFGFFKILSVSARTRGEGVNFSRFCADVFYGRPLNKVATGQRFATLTGRLFFESYIIGHAQLHHRVELGPVDLLHAYLTYITKVMINERYNLNH